VVRTTSKISTGKHDLVSSGEEIRNEIRDIVLILAKELSNTLKHGLGSKQELASLSGNFLIAVLIEPVQNFLFFMNESLGMRGLKGTGSSTA